MLLGRTAADCRAELQFTGVNLAGAEFGESNLPGTYGQTGDYVYPNAAEVSYFVGKGANTFRVPFRWERLQRSLNADFDATELSRLDAFVTSATQAGAYIVLDPHNYARYRSGGTETIIGNGAVTNAAFADFWSRLANVYKDNDHVIFCLMNEPNTMPTEQWLTAANAAIASIRNTGAENLVLVPGNAWTGAHSWNQNWYGTPNGTVMLNVVDPADNYAYDVHQYLDTDSSGTTSTVVSATIGRERLVDFTNWLHANNKRGFLGEFAVPNSRIGSNANQIGDEAIDNMLDYIEENDDVWLGWTWWAAGPKWGNYLFTAEPTNLGLPNQADRPVMNVIAPHFVVPGNEPPGDFNKDGSIDAADYTIWRDQGGTPEQYADWKANFGTTQTGGGTGSVSVPEPCGLLLLIAGAAFPATGRRRAA
jgi:endoglucanase